MAGYVLAIVLAFVAGGLSCATKAILEGSSAVTTAGCIRGIFGGEENSRPATLENSPLIDGERNEP